MMKRFICLIAVLLLSGLLLTELVSCASVVMAADEASRETIEEISKESSKETSAETTEETPREITEDYNPGSLTYMLSADGKNVTISYLLNGERVSYTVPNNKTYFSGGFAGVDDLGRPLYSSDTEGVGAVSAEQERYVGLFYFLWMGTASTQQDPNVWWQKYHGGIARNLQKIWDGETELGLGVWGEMHWFAEPLYGYYMSNDTWVMRKHVELLTNAGVDFLYFDFTNNVSYVDNALKLMKILHEFNQQGYDAPQVVFYTNTEAKTRIQEVYEGIYKRDRYSDTWFCIDGKPVIIAPNITDDDVIPDTNIKIKEYFTLKSGQWPIACDIEDNFSLTNNSWPWIDFHWPQKVYTNADGEEGAINVSIAQHSGSGNFGDSVLYGYKFNRGRSFTAEGTSTDRWQYWSGATKYNRRLSQCYNAAKNDPTLSYQGLNFQEQFDYAIASDAKYILITGWNEWIAGNWVDDYRPKGNFVDAASIEYSRDAEMMRGGYFDNYYMQMVYNIQRIKGTAPVIVQDARKPIDVTGSFDQWEDVLLTYFDPSGDTVDRNNRAFTDQVDPNNIVEGQDYAITLTNTSGRNDIVASKVVSDSKNVYFYIETADTITARDNASSWMQVYVNADRDATTGWYGYDYIVNYRTESDTVTTVAAYTGIDGAYGFTPCEQTVSYRTEGNRMMIAVPLSLMGIENYLAIDMEFKIADSETMYDEMEDFYCDGDIAPLGRLNFVFSNYDPSSSAETETETETQTETVVETQTETTVETQTETPVETQTETTVETQTETPVETQTETTVETQTETTVETQTETAVETQTETTVETQTETTVETQTETTVETQTETTVETQAETTVETQTETTVETQTETTVEIQTETTVETQTETTVETQTETPVETQTETTVETQTETTVETQTETTVETQTETPVETQTETTVETQTETKVEVDAETETVIETSDTIVTETFVETTVETTVETKVETEAPVETVAKTETESGPKTDDTSKPTNENGGCTGMIGGAAALTLLTLLSGAACVIRKRH